MQAYIIYLHSIVRYFILLFALLSTILAVVSVLGKKDFRKNLRTSSLLLMIFCDLQLLLGLSLYYMRVIATGMFNGGDVMTDPGKRFWAVEHSFGMLIAIILVHMGYNFVKRTQNTEKMQKRVFWCVFVALVILVAMIPWEGKQVVGRPNVPVLNVQ